MTLSRSIRTVFLAGAMLIFSAQAQTLSTGELTGTVTDPSGAFVAAAKVDLTSQASGQQTSVASSSIGEFRFSLLPPGPYTLTVTAPGFEPKTQPTTVELGQSSNLSIQLGVQAGKQAISVSGEAPLLQNNNANLVTTFDPQQIDNLPDPGGDMTAFALTAPGVVVNSTGVGVANDSNGNFSAFGLPSISNLFTVNGVDVTDIYYNLNPAGATKMTLGANEIQEMAIVTNGYLGQYGRLAGANVNYVTKSGGNLFHGNALWYYNSEVLNANDFFKNLSAQSRPFSISNRWAGSLGGPILKDKLFFFLDTEGMRYEFPVAQPASVPTPAFANYVLAGLQQSNSAALPLYQNIFNLYAAAPGAASATPLSQSCGNVSSPVLGALQSCAELFEANEANPNSEWLLTGRVDYNLDNHDRFYIRLNTDHGTQSTYTDLINPVFDAYSSQPTYRAQLGYTRIITPHSVNTLLLGANYTAAVIGPSNLGAALQTFPTTLTFNPGYFSRLGGEDNMFPSGRKTRQWQLVDDYSFVYGRHTFKAGVNARQSWVSSYFYGAQSSGVLTFGSMSDFASGSLSAPASSYAQAITTVGAEDLSVLSAGFYGQDEWRVRPNLMVTLSLRLDRNSNYECPGGCFTEFVRQGSFENIAHGATIPYNQSIQTGLTHAFGAVDAISPQPRIGIAYNLTKSTVLRGGFGIFADSNPAVLFDRFITNPPAVYIASAKGLVAPPDVATSVFSTVANSAHALLEGFNSGATLPQLQTEVPGFTPPQVFSISSPVHTPRYYEWNVELQQVFSRRYALSVNYVGNHGSNELVQNVAENAYSLQGYAGLPTSAPDPRFAEIDALNNQGWSNYDGLVTSFRWRMSSRFSGQFSYTWGHALDTCSNACVPAPFYALADYRFQINPLNLGSLNYSNADYDVRHSLNANYLYLVPTGSLKNRMLKAVLGGWRAGGTVFFHTGFPFSIVDPGAPAGFSNVIGKVNQPFLADFLGGSSYPSCTSVNVVCYSASEFANPTTQQNFGNIPRNSFRGPHYFDTDLNLNKSIPVFERYSLLIGASFFNILNHPNFAAPVNTLGSPIFGRILSTVSAPTSAYGSFGGSAVSGRVIQTQIKLSF